MRRGGGGEGREGRFVAAQGDVGGQEGRREFRPKSREERFVDQEGLGCVACRRVGGLSASRVRPLPIVLPRPGGLTLESTTTLIAFSSTALSSTKTAHKPSACPMTGIRVPF